MEQTIIKNQPKRHSSITNFWQSVHKDWLFWVLICGFGLLGLGIYVLVRKDGNRGVFILPYLILAILFIIVPLVFLFIQAFISFEGGFTFNNFLSFSEMGGWSLLWRSIRIAGITTLICLVIAYPVALILSSKEMKVPLIVIMFFIVPMLINVVLRTFALREIFMWIERAVRESRGEVFNLSDDFKIITALILDYFPFMLLPIYTILRTQDKSLQEAAADLGASKIRVFLKVVLPLSVAGIISGIMMVFLPAISNFAIPYIVMEFFNAESQLLGNLIWHQFSSRTTYNVGAAYGLILLLLVATSVAIITKFTKGKAKGGISF
ncbi:MAG: ABC transporter permease [Firmicutes bacterium]|nr:ABC transporter permease [Bacillota bacterium]